MFGIQTKEACPVGRRYRYAVPMSRTVLEFWAEGGMVCLEDQDTGEYTVWTQAEARDHFKVIGQALLKIDIFSVSDSYFKDLNTEYGRLAANFHDVLLDARAQGDPMESVVVERKERADVRTQLASYNRGLQILHNDGERVRELPADPRAKRLKNGTLWLPHGQGRPYVPKTFTV